MGAKSTKGLAVWMSDGSDPVKLIPTAITKAKPAVVTVPSTAGMTEGDPVYVNVSGFSELDKKYFVAGMIDTETFELTGSDTTASTGTLSSAPELDTWPAADLVKLCPSEVTFNPETPGTVSVGTFCDPSATLPSAATSAGTITITGYVDIEDPGYAALLAAEADSKERILDMVLSQDQGHIIAPVTIATVTWATPLDGAIGYTAQGALASKPVHIF